ncbi:TetR/AcrR family transcriptional regulator C-terminal domain-containing protein [Cellulomonas sp. ATA003]|uniref:TetR/AcrR family transcriptional regulator n=1 Tax=Cellulomonas sp. ATA003 TaxID=3073064 RepID=UPI0028731DD1|nr:TetR/AcrR family transcriptional regulator C-terminal domain-containing protein [Cellulomonas sp. ATA003]WNB85905.1 TetR/AcrR family transcriptional regulator C-terminal domain-containing protein [Cellulomonas sp. ATA003]
MSPDRTSAGDPARTLALLWRDPTSVPRRGPRRALDLDAVVTEAIGVADDDGLAGLTMRRVADRLGVATMSVYTYAGKDDLLDLMLDAVLAAAPRADTSGRGWRERVGAVAEENRDLYRAHPWAAEVSTLRPPLGPGQMARYEHELAAWDGCGLDDVTIDDCLTQLLGFVRTCARDAGAVRAARRDSGMDDAQWWAGAAPVLARVLDPARYPRAIRIGEAAGRAHGSAHDPEHAYRFGLERLLDGFAVLIDRAVPR